MSTGYFCSSCNSRIRFLTLPFHDGGDTLCKFCKRERVQRYEKFHTAYVAMVNLPTGFNLEHVKQLESTAQKLGLDFSQALLRSESVTAIAIKKLLTFITLDGIIDDQEKMLFESIATHLRVPLDSNFGIIGQYRYNLHISEIRKGNLPNIDASHIIPTHEVCHFHADAFRMHETQNGINRYPGRILVTGDKFRFIANRKGAEVSLKNVCGAYATGSKEFCLELTQNLGAGMYSVNDPIYACEIILSATKVFHRQLDIYQSQSRTIPQSVKNNVYNRDRGRCVQCASSHNIEFDHIIPFSKGGATSENNLQILCRSCNLKKGSKI